MWAGPWGSFQGAGRGHLLTCAPQGSKGSTLPRGRGRVRRAGSKRPGGRDGRACFSGLGCGWQPAGERRESGRQPGSRPLLISQLLSRAAPFSFPLRPLLGGFRSAAGAEPGAGLSAAWAGYPAAGVGGRLLPARGTSSRPPGRKRGSAGASSPHARTWFPAAPASVGSPAGLAEAGPSSLQSPSPPPRLPTARSSGWLAFRPDLGASV